MLPITIIFLSMPFFVCSNVQYRKLELLTSGPPSQLAKELTFDQIEKMRECYWLFEVHEIEDLADLIKYFHSGDEVWLGHRHIQSLGWYNLSTNETNAYLNSKSTSKFRKPRCPKCCLVFKAQKDLVNRRFIPVIELTDCTYKYKGAWAVLRTRKSPMQEALDKLKVDFENYKNGMGEVVTLDSI